MASLCHLSSTASHDVCFRELWVLGKPKSSETPVRARHHTTPHQLPSGPPLESRGCGTPVTHLPEAHRPLVTTHPHTPSRGTVTIQKDKNASVFTFFIFIIYILIGPQANSFLAYVPVSFDKHTAVHSTPDKLQPPEMPPPSSQWVPPPFASVPGNHRTTSCSASPERRRTEAPPFSPCCIFRLDSCMFCIYRKCFRVCAHVCICVWAGTHGV